MTDPCSPLFKKSCIIGLGLMGGSLGMALGRYAISAERWGYDIDSRAMSEARERGAVDRTAPLDEALEGADLVVLSLPIRETISLLKKIAPLLSEGAIVTDVGSSKREIVQVMDAVLPFGVMGLGGHPMAGSERSGITAADPLLLENAIYVLTPTENTPHRAVETLRKAILSMKAIPVVLEPDEHDRLVALVSHLPHLAAVALVNAVKNCGEKEELLLTLAGGGFRDTTRITMGEPSVWYDIFVSNKEHLRASLEKLLREIELLVDTIERGDENRAKDNLRQAARFRRSIPYRGRGFLPEVYELIILIADVPGVLGKVASLVGEAGLNISEIEILRVREEEGGSIRIGFSSPAEREKALEILTARGYRAWKRG